MPLNGLRVVSGRYTEILVSVIVRARRDNLVYRRPNYGTEATRGHAWGRRVWPLSGVAGKPGGYWPTDCVRAAGWSHDLGKRWSSPPSDHQCLSRTAPRCHLDAIYIAPQQLTRTAVDPIASTVWAVVKVRGTRGNAVHGPLMIAGERSQTPHSR